MRSCIWDELGIVDQTAVVVKEELGILDNYTDPKWIGYIRWTRYILDEFHIVNEFEDLKWVWLNVLDALGVLV